MLPKSKLKRCFIGFIVLYGTVELASEYLLDLGDRRLAYVTADQIFVDVAPSVVRIDTRVDKDDAKSGHMGPPRIEEFPGTESKLGGGSGFVWDKEGHVITNFHVVQQVKEAKVTVYVPHNTTENRTEYEQIDYLAEVVGTDPGNDVAVLKIQAPEEHLHPVTAGSTKFLRVGEPAYAIGHPFGLDHSMSSGIISGLAREMSSPWHQPLENIIQTDVSINPGSSGGVLLNGYGETIGTTTATISTPGGASGVGFVVPIESVKKSAEQIIQKGFVEKPGMGITLLDPVLAKMIGIENGVMIQRVQEGNAAHQAGLRGTQIANRFIKEYGDIIKKIDDEEIGDMDEMHKVLSKHQIGDKVRVTILRPQHTQVVSSWMTPMLRSAKIEIEGVEMEMELTLVAVSTQ